MSEWLVWQDGAALPQLDLPERWALRLGGMREIAMQFLGLLAIPNGAMIGLTWYRGSEAAQSLFPTALWFMGVYVGLALVGMIVYYVVVYRAFRQFVHTQGEKSDVSPLMSEVQRLHSRLDEIEQEVQD